MNAFQINHTARIALALMEADGCGADLGSPIAFKYVRASAAALDVITDEIWPPMNAGQSCEVMDKMVELKDSDAQP